MSNNKLNIRARLVMVGCATFIALPPAALVDSALAQVTPNQPTPQATCGDSVAISNGEGAAETTISFNLKTGDYSDCPNAGRVDTGKKVYLYCFFDNGYWNTWWYIRVAGTATYGWTSANNLRVLPGQGDDDGDGVVQPPLRCTGIT